MLSAGFLRAAWGGGGSWVLGSSEIDVGETGDLEGSCVLGGGWGVRWVPLPSEEKGLAKGCFPDRKVSGRLGLKSE